MAQGLIDADLGSGLVKKRIARSGAGKRGGFRALVANRSGGPWFFIRGYAKNAMSNVGAESLFLCRATAHELTTTTNEGLSAMLANGQLKEVNCDAKTEE